jgi:hypothetical protein
MQLFLVGLDLALIAAAALLLLVVLLRRGRGMSYFALALFLIALAIGLWYTGIRNPPLGVISAFAGDVANPPQQSAAGAAPRTSRQGAPSGSGK